MEIDPDQTLHSPVSDLDLHCLLRPARILKAIRVKQTGAEYLLSTTSIPFFHTLYTGWELKLGQAIVCLKKIQFQPIYEFTMKLLNNIIMLGPGAYILTCE